MAPAPAKALAGPLLALAGVSKFYGEKLVFKNIDFELAPASSTLLLGANGAGKSTLLRIMACLSEPSSGQITRAAGLRTAYLGHPTFLYPALSAYENLAFQAKIQRMPASPDKIMELLKLVRLERHAGEPARHFSRGMAQRLNFARALLRDPDVFLLDEPYTGMDQDSREVVARELEKRKAKGAGMLVSSHAPLQDLPRADRVALLAKKRLVCGTPEDFQTLAKAS